MSRQRSVRQVVSHCVAARKFVLLSVLFTALGVFAVQSFAQNQPSTDDDEVLRVTTDLLLFPARVRDRKGQRPNGLKEQDLSLKDPDGVVSGLYFAAGVDRVAIVFALDESGSLREIIGKQRDAAIGLHQRFNALSSIAVLRFSDKPTVAAPFARQSSEAAAAFEVRARDNRRTAIFDAAAKAVAMFKSLPRVRSERRIVILISDGLDNASTTKADSVIDNARADRVSFYIIHLPLFEPRDGRLAVRRPASSFRELAEKTGGKYFLTADSPFSPRATVDLNPIFQAIEDDLKSQYLIGFYLSEKAHDGEPHNFSLSVPQGLEFQIIPRSYSRTQPFFVNRPREALKPRS